MKPRPPFLGARTLARLGLTSLLLCVVGCAHTRHQPAASAVEAMQGEPLYRAGMQLLHEGDLTRAEQYLASALRAGYDRASVLKALMATCIGAGRLRSALSYAEPYIADHPDQLQLRLLVASLHFSLEGFARTEQELSFVLHAAETTPEAHYLMALLLLKQGGSPAAARGHFQRYLELAPAGSHAAEAQSALKVAADNDARGRSTQRRPEKREKTLPRATRV